MIDLYTWTTPNGRKAAIMLEECGLEYRVHPINIRNKEQFAPEFLKISPNNKIPAIVDHDTDSGPVSVFESGAVLIYLAEKTGKLLAAKGAQRAKTMEWLMWQVGGLGPMLGQLSYFVSAPEDDPFAVNRFQTEAVRLIKVLDKRLSETKFVAGDYSIADIMIFPWLGPTFESVMKAKAAEIGEARHIRRWLEAVGSRPAVQAGMQIPKI